MNRRLDLCSMSAAAPHRLHDLLLLYGLLPDSLLILRNSLLKTQHLSLHMCSSANPSANRHQSSGGFWHPLSRTSYRIRRVSVE